MLLHIAQEGLTEAGAPSQSVPPAASPGHVLLSGYQGLSGKKPN